jgi:hypothetical protein
MGTKNSDNRVFLQADMSGDDERVRAVLAGWGLEENSIYRLLTEGHPGHSPLMKRPAAPRPDETVTLLHGGTLPRGGYASH